MFDYNKLLLDSYAPNKPNNPFRELNEVDIEMTKLSDFASLKRRSDVKKLQLAKTEIVKN